jgi:hypothetical protein
MSAQDQARLLMIRHHQFVKNRQHSLLSRTAVEVGLPLDSVADYNGTVQGKLNAGFSATYDRSSASLS